MLYYYNTKEVTGTYHFPPGPSVFSNVDQMTFGQPGLWISTNHELLIDVPILLM